MAVDADDTELKKAYRRQAMKVESFQVHRVRLKLTRITVPSGQEQVSRRRREGAFFFSLNIARSNAVPIVQGHKVSYCLPGNFEKFERALWPVKHTRSCLTR